MNYYRCNECKNVDFFEDNGDRCKECNSSSIIPVTKEYAEFYNGKYDKEQLLKKATSYLKAKDYENALCFANASNIDNEKSYDALIIKVLASYKVPDISGLEEVKGDLNINNDFKEALELANKTKKKKLLKVLDSNQEIIKKEKYKKANKLFKETDITSLTDAYYIYDSLGNYKDSKKKLAQCRNKLKQECEELKSINSKNENIQALAVASIILVIIVMIVLLII